MLEIGSDNNDKEKSLKIWSDNDNVGGKDIFVYAQFVCPYFIFFYCSCLADTLRCAEIVCFGDIF